MKERKKENNFGSKVKWCLVSFVTKIIIANKIDEDKQETEKNIKNHAIH